MENTTANTVTTLDLNGDSQEQNLERMKSEFRAAQQRRRHREHQAAPRPHDTNDAPRDAGPGDRDLTATAAICR
jgi:hypothetical protein